jgi:putative alpha-1,2-mannosidase
LKARISLPGGKTFVVKRQNASAQNKYVQQVTLDGQPLKSPFHHLRRHHGGQGTGVQNG